MICQICTIPGPIFPDFGAYPLPFPEVLDPKFWHRSLDLKFHFGSGPRVVVPPLKKQIAAVCVCVGEPPNSEMGPGLVHILVQP